MKKGVVVGIVVAVVVITLIWLLVPKQEVEPAAEELALSPTSGLVAHYEFEDNARDSAGDDDGTAEEISYVTGVKGKAARFDGQFSWVDLGNLDILDGVSEATISMWVRHAGNSPSDDDMFTIGVHSTTLGEMAIWRDHPPTGSDRYAFFIKDDDGDVGGVRYSNHVPQNNVWTHFALVFKGSEYAKIYINGIEDSTFSMDGIDNIWTVNDIYTIGGDGAHAQPQLFWGDIDEFKIWNRALSFGEIQAEYNSATDPLTLVAHYAFEGNADDSAGDNDGEAVNVEYVGGVLGEAARFDGQSSWIDLGNLDILDGVSKATLSMWVRHAGDSPNDDDMFTIGVHDTNLGEMAIWRDNAVTDHYAFFVKDDDGDVGVKYSNYVPQDNVWTHFALVFDGGVNAKIYINGETDFVFDMSGVGNIWTVNDIYTIGGDGAHAQPQLFWGDIDEFKIWRGALTDEQILAEYGSDGGNASCTPNWETHNTNCRTDETYETYFTDSNNCGQTRENETSYCDYDNNGFIGTTSDIDDLNVEVEIFVNDVEVNFSESIGDTTETVEIKNEGRVLVSFEHDFSTPLNLKNILIKTESSYTSYGYIIVKGINDEKTVTVSKMVSNSSAVCVEDRADISSISSVSSNCGGSSEHRVPCPGSDSGFSCSIDGDEFVVSGLEHSGVREYVMSSPGVCIPDWDCADDDWGACVNGLQTRLCPDNNGCGTTVGRPALSKTCGTTPPPGCTPDWDCSDWEPEECPEDEVQTRDCTDLNSCGTTAGKPDESKSCTYVRSYSSIWIIVVVIVVVLIIAALVVLFIVLGRGKKRGGVGSIPSRTPRTPPPATVMSVQRPGPPMRPITR